jgi:hypothetical protein
MNPLVANQFLNKYPTSPLMSTSNALISQAALSAIEGWNYTQYPNQCPAYFESRQKITQLPSTEFGFEGEVSQLFEKTNLDIKPASTGVHKTPILYDSDSGKAIAVFKPNGGWMTSVNWGDVLAYRLDHDSFANVPLAFRFAKLSERAPQREYFLSGSFIKWVPNAREMTATEQMQLINEDRQVISILDMRLGNYDRNVGNVLVDKEGKLVPIDHDYTFTSYKRYAGACYGNQPLSQKCQDYILNLDLNRDIAILREFDVPENEIENFVIRTIFLKLAAEANRKSPIKIGHIEEIIESIKLPSGRGGAFFDSWVYRNPLRKILTGCSKPYNELELKQAFQEFFNSYLMSAGKGFIEKTLKSWFCKPQ